MTSTKAGTPRIQASRYLPMTFSLRCGCHDRTEHGVCPARARIQLAVQGAVAGCVPPASACWRASRASSRMAVL